MDYENWNVLNLIGQGAYAKVYLVRRIKASQNSVLTGSTAAGTMIESSKSPETKPNRYRESVPKPNKTP